MDLKDSEDGEVGQKESPLGDQTGTTGFVGFYRVLWVFFIRFWMVLVDFSFYQLAFLGSLFGPIARW